MMLLAMSFLSLCGCAEGCADGSRPFRDLVEDGARVLVGGGQVHQDQVEENIQIVTPRQLLPYSLGFLSIHAVAIPLSVVP